MTHNSSSLPIWDDGPLEETDISGRAAFAAAIADRINNCHLGQRSTVFGLVGPWGSGKTTLLQVIENKLTHAEDKKQRGKWETVWFSPWSAGDVGSITTEFVSALMEAFPRSSSVKEKLAGYARFGAPAIQMIPVVGEAVAGLTEQVFAAVTKSPWYKEFEELSAQIADEEKRVMVIIDDVDRLDGEELRSLLRVVRLLGRFTNVHYLMAYDAVTLDRMLESTGVSGTSSEFMEKIVQYPFEVPPVPLIARQRWSRSVLDASIPEQLANSSSYLEQRDQLVRILAAGLETPRAVNRLREQLLSLNVLITQAEVDPLDFAALTWLRVAHHQVWDHIRLHKDEFLSLSGHSDDAEAIIKRTKEHVQRGPVRPVEDAVRYLFGPGENATIVLFQPTNFAGMVSERRWGIRKYQYFDRYFLIGIADDDVSERKVHAAVRDLAEGNSTSPHATELNRLILKGSEERSSLALRTALNLRRNSQKVSPSQPMAVVDYVDTIRIQMEPDSGRYRLGYSEAFEWLCFEIFLELKFGTTLPAELIRRFGYLILLRSAYLANYPSQEERSIKRLYFPVAQNWIDKVGQEPLETTLARGELVEMTSFCLWTDVEDHRGFLTSQIDDNEDLVNVAMRYVSYNEWTGPSGSSYDVTFRSREFTFAVGYAVNNFDLADLQTTNDPPDYELSDRASPDLTEPQRRDYAIRVLRGDISDGAL